MKHTTFRLITIPIATLLTATAVWYDGSCATGFPPPHRFLTETQRNEFASFKDKCGQPGVARRIAEPEGKKTGVESLDKLICAEILFTESKKPTAIGFW